jgi:hypothetical protein
MFQDDFREVSGRETLAIFLVLKQARNPLETLLKISETAWEARFQEGEQLHHLGRETEKNREKHLERKTVHGRRASRLFFSPAQRGWMRAS